MRRPSPRHLLASLLSPLLSEVLFVVLSQISRPRRQWRSGRFHPRGDRTVSRRSLRPFGTHSLHSRPIRITPSAGAPRHINRHSIFHAQHLPPPVPALGRVGFFAPDIYVASRVIAPICLLATCTAVSALKAHGHLLYPTAGIALGCRAWAFSR